LKKNPKPEKKGGHASKSHWAATAFCLAVALSAALSLASEAMLSGAGLAIALFILCLFILLGILFDIIGVAVTAADPKPFHSMAAHKVKGAKESLKLLKNASTVSSVCNDVVGDICGIVSGTTTTVIVVRLQGLLDFVPALVLSVGLTALVSGFTIGGKALGKGVAMKSSTKVVYFVGRVISVFHR
jgi:CBS domain containing-hemolysin-like protein